VRVSSNQPVPITPADSAVLEPDALAQGWRLGCRLVLAADASVELGPLATAPREKSFGAPHLIEPGRVPVRGVPTAAWQLGLAIDIGTTTLALALIDLASGEVGAARTQLNPQLAMGADVMSRIARASESEAARQALTSTVRDAIGRTSADMAREIGASPIDVVSVAVVGNPTMIQLWLGRDVASLGQAPFKGSLSGAVRLNAGDVDCPAHPQAPVYGLPGLQSHVGSDAVGGAVAVGLDCADGPVLLLDLGTNSEVVLQAGSRMFAASTAAGPAFEGRSISIGMRAEDGAIDAVRITDDGSVVTRSIGHVTPRGVCGSGLIDAVAELRRWQIIDVSGALRSADAVEGTVPETLRARIVEREWGRGFLLAGNPEAGVILRATDVRQLQLAAGSIRAGIAVLLAEAGLAAADLTAMLVAGNFGHFVRKPSLARLGLVPDMPLERVQLAGNVAGVAARLALLDERFRERVEKLAATATFVDLGGRPGYTDAFMEALTFPAVE
jgi:uncharacterized 2Fe-2S/4Fe-4S cluster protein (DUF4445 family)